MPDEGDEKNYYKIYESIWRNVERENNLIHYRIQWAIALSGGILVTEGILVTGVRFAFATPPTYLIPGGSLALMFLLSCIALFFCLQSREGVRAAIRQIDYLRSQYWSHKTSSGKNLFEETLKLPRLFGADAEHFQENRATRVFPGTMEAILAIWTIFGAIELIGAIVCFVLFANQYQIVPSSTPRAMSQQHSVHTEHL
jgi:hypothetical protein